MYEVCTMIKHLQLPHLLSIESKICSRKVISESVVLKIMFRCQLVVCFFVCFQPPYVCPFQTADYTIEVQQNGTNETFTHGPVNYSPATMREMVSLRVPAQLVVNTEYVLHVTASTLAGRKSFTTNFTTDFSES